MTIEKFEPKSARIMVTPEIAREWLKDNEKNRPVSPNLVKNYARAIAEGRWKLNGETIKFSPSGALLDGQHRLLACLQAKLPFETIVMRDVSPDSFDTIDVGRKRTAGDIIGLEGCKNATVTAAGIRWVLTIRRGLSSDGAVLVSADEVRQLWLNDPRFEVSATAVHGLRSVIRPSIAAALHYLFGEKDEAAADFFFARLKSGTEMSFDNPIFVLRERLIRNNTEKLKLKNGEVAALTIRAWNCFRAGQTTRNLKGSITGKDGEFIMPIIK